jgi:hypothetical protein
MNDATRTMELVQINPQEFGLTDEIAKNISAQFQPMLDKMVELENEFNQVVSLPIEDPETTKKAKELRIKYVKVRTGTADIHKTQKAFYLNGGRFVDGWKNAQLFASQGKESKLEEIEKYQENLIKQAQEKLQSERIELIRPFIDDTTALNFGEMPEDVWNAYFNAKKQAYADKLEAERKAEEERQAAIKAEQERIEAQRIENERLKAEAEAREKEIEAERKAQQAIIDKERAEREAEAKKQADIIEAQRKEAERLTAELKAKQDAEAKAEAERIAAQESAANAPDKDKLIAWVKTSELAELPKVNAKCSKVAKDIADKHAAFLAWASTQIESIK